MDVSLVELGAPFADVRDSFLELGEPDIAADRQPILGHPTGAPNKASTAQIEHAENTRSGDDERYRSPARPSCASASNATEGVRLMSRHTRCDV
jgi:hypothetical protein